MNSMKLKLLEELLSHLSGSQGMDLKALLDKSKMPPEMGEPKGVSMEKVSLMGGDKDMGSNMSDADDAGVGAEGMPGPKGDEEMSDEELKELLSQLT